MGGINFSLGSTLGAAAASAFGVPGILAGAYLGKQAGKAYGKATGTDITRFNTSGPAKKSSAPIQKNQQKPPANNLYPSDSSSDYYSGGSSYADQQAAQIRQQQQSLLDQLGANINQIYGSSTDSARQSGLGLDTAIRQFGLQTRQAQDAINQKGVQNEASKRAGTADILSMVGRGIRSGGVTLANKNASSSSAADAIARAYGDIGQREQSKVNNQYALGQEDINSQQKALTDQESLYRDATYANNKEQIIGGIVQSAQGQLAELDNALRGASLPDRIAIENEKAKVRGLAQNELAKYDSLLASQLASAHANSQDENRAKATQLSQLGQAPAGQFEYNTEAPAQFQGQAPAGGNLPLFSLRKNQDQNNPLALQGA